MKTQSFFIYFFRVFKHRTGDDPAAVLITMEKAALPAGMTGDIAGLHHCQNDGVLVTVEVDVLYLLCVA